MLSNRIISSVNSRSVASSLRSLSATTAIQMIRVPSLHSSSIGLIDHHNDMRSSHPVYLAARYVTNAPTAPSPAQNKPQAPKPAAKKKEKDQSGKRKLSGLAFWKPMPFEPEKFVKTKIIESHTLKDITQEHVGKMIHFNEAELKRYFTEGPGGSLEQDVTFVGRGNSIALLVRQETVDLINHLKENQKSGFNLHPYTLIDGDRGCGKSAIMQLLVYWARKNNYIVVFVPDGYKFVAGKYITESNVYKDGFDQHDIGHALLQATYDAHKEQLEKLPVRLEYKIGETKFGPTKTLADMVKVGIDDMQLSCDSAYWLRRELALVTEYPVLIAVDGMNHLWGNSAFLDPNDRKLRTDPLPADQLTLAYNYRDYKNHGLINGTTIACSTRKHVVTKEVLNHPAHFKIPTLKLQESHDIMNYYEESGWFVSEIPGRTRTFIHYLSDGRGDQIFRYCRSL